MASNAVLLFDEAVCLDSQPQSQSFDFLSIAVDHTYSLLKKCLLPGKGRPPALPQLPLTNHLLVKLKALQLEGDKTLTDVASWFDKLFPDVSFPSSRLAGVLNRMETTLRTMLAEGKDLTTYLRTELDFDCVSPSLSKHGLKRGQLLHEQPWTPQASVPITQEDVLTLDKFMTKEKKPLSFTVAWIKKLMISNMSDEDVKLNLKRLKEYHDHVRKQQSKEPSVFQFFLAAYFKLQSREDLTRPKTTESGTAMEKKLIQENNVLDKKCRKLTSQLAEAESEKEVLKEVVKDLSADKMLLQQQVDERQTVIEMVTGLQEELEHLQQQIQDYDPRNLRRKIRRLAQLRDEYRAARQLERRLELSQLNLQDQKRKTDAERVRACKARKNVAKLMAENERLHNEIENLVLEMETASECLQPLKDKVKNRYSDNVRKTLMSLQGNGVPSTKCSDVIRIVAENMFNVVIDQPLPCPTTAGNVMDEGQVLSRYKTGEQILVAENVTVHLDGTSRDGNKFIGAQVTLDTGESLSLGFATLATEDAVTLLDVMVHLLQEITEIYSDGATVEEQDVVFKSLLAKLTSTMTDRAACMKKFDRLFEEFIKSKIGQEARVLFTHCNAHFLLGMSRACDMGLSAVEKALGVKLGRDQLPKFNRFSKTENAPSRLIRAASSITGPRGDEKNGCRGEWLAYCEEVKVCSLMTNYRSNRFNSFFLGAAAIIYHIQHLKDFLGKGYLTHANMKIESVAADCADDTVVSWVCAVALLYLQVTGPYWQLVQSKVTHDNFSWYAKQLENSFERWATDSTELLDRDFQGIFRGEFQIDCPAKESVFNYAAQHSVIVEEALRGTMPHMLETTRSQLKEYLTGVYSLPLSEEDRKALAHCPITNLLGENVFGEIDFDMGKRRHSTFHHRSSVQMMSHNNTASWLSTKSDEESQHLMALARKRGKQLRLQHRQQEKVIKLQIRQKLLENERQKRLKEAKAAQQRADLIQKVLAHGGPCQHKEDVVRLNRTMKGRSLVATLKNEIRYQKTVLKTPGTLRLTGSAKVLSKALKDHLPQYALHDDELDVPGVEMLLDAVGEEEPCQQEKFTFTAQGVWVATYYDEQFYVGQVIQVHSPQSADVKYMERLTSRTDLFRWPKGDDIAKTEALYVFKWDFDVIATVNDRFWQITNIKEIEEAYARISGN